MREYRKAYSDDNLEISRISVEGWRHAYKNIMPEDLLASMDYEKRATGRAEFLKETALSTYICIENDTAVGFIDFELCRDQDCDETAGEIWAIYVLPDMIGKGVGKDLLQMAAKDLSERGCEEIVVWVLSDNHLGKAFYERQGFTADGEEKEYQGLLEVRYRRPI